MKLQVKARRIWLTGLMIVMALGMTQTNALAQGTPLVPEVSLPDVRVDRIIPLWINGAEGIWMPREAANQIAVDLEMKDIYKEQVESVRTFIAEERARSEALFKSAKTFAWLTLGVVTIAGVVRLVAP